jgi:hypothetical protein
MTEFHLAYLEIVMSATLGNDWPRYFDIYIGNTRKPLFYRGENCFWAVDLEQENLKRRLKVNTSKDLLKLNHGPKKLVFLEGNVTLLTGYF